MLTETQFGHNGFIERHIITPEYPPQCGGVSDYVVQLAEGLAREGEEVHVWAPGVSDISSPRSEAGPTVHVHRDLGRVTPEDLKAVGQKLDQYPAPRRIFLQWVPHGFGYRSMNLGLCLWLWKRARRGDQLEIMVHEAFLVFEGSWRQYLAALVHRLMTVILLGASDRIWVSTPRWEKILRPYTLGRYVPFQWLPLPSNVPVVFDPRAVTEIRTRYAPPRGLLIGHFGTFGKLMNPFLEQLIPPILERNPGANVLLIGPGAEFLDELLRVHPQLASRIHTTGSLAATNPALSHHIGACDLFIQPYVDGVSSRRTSLMAPLHHGKAVVTTSGPTTEDIWFKSHAVALTETGDTAGFVDAVSDLCAESSKRDEMAHAARSLFEDRFDIRHVVAALRMASSDSIRSMPA